MSPLPSPQLLVNAMGSLIRGPQEVSMTKDYAALLEEAFKERGKSLQWGVPVPVFRTEVTFKKIEGEGLLVFHTVPHEHCTEPQGDPPP